MALAFLVMAHRSPHQVGRLLRAIYRPGDRCVVHVDGRAAREVHRTIRAEVYPLSGVDVLPSTSIRWGGWSMVDVQLRAIRHLLATENEWSHFINLSGQDFPLQPTAVVEAELSSRQDRSYLEYFRPRDAPWTWENPAFKAHSAEFRRPESRIDRFYVEGPRPLGVRPLPMVRRHLPTGTTWYGGSQWMILSREACRYTTESREAKRLRTFYKHTFIPDESFFQTTLLNSPLRDTVVNDYRRAVLWRPDVVTYTKKHLNFLLSSDAWYARKFDEDLDPDILDVLEERLLGCPP